VKDDGFRFEQLSDFLAKVCEHHLPWTIGIILDWVVTDTATPICQDVPNYVHYGVPDDVALALMAGGVRSRRLAVTVGREARTEGVDETGARGWLTALGLQGWRSRLQASPAEASDLMRFVRDNTKGMSAKLLGGDAVALQLETIAADVTAGEVGTVDFALNEEDPRPLAVLDGFGEEIAPIGAADQRGLEVLLEAGFVLTATVTSVGDTPGVTLRLDE
jgi:hypothetical protein